MNISDDWWVEHVIPHSLGGSNDSDNLLPSCRLCNSVRSNHTPEYVRQILFLGSVIIREVNCHSPLGIAINECVRLREKRLASKRKYPDLAMTDAVRNTIRRERIEAERKPATE